MGRVLPPLRNEPTSFLLLPMPAISGVVAALLYPVLLHQRSRASRVLWLYVGFLVVLVLYGLYLWWMIPDGTVGLIVPALLAGHLYGLPALLTFLLASSVMDRILFPSPTSRVDASELNLAR
jgi:apolipoprotein N-acyltransferase